MTKIYDDAENRFLHLKSFFPTLHNTSAWFWLEIVNLWQSAQVCNNLHPLLNLILEWWDMSLFIQYGGFHHSELNTMDAQSCHVAGVTATLITEINCDAMRKLYQLFKISSNQRDQNLGRKLQHWSDEWQSLLCDTCFKNNNSVHSCS